MQREIILWFKLGFSKGWIKCEGLFAGILCILLEITLPKSDCGQLWTHSRLDNWSGNANFRPHVQGLDYKILAPFSILPTKASDQKQTSLKMLSKRSVSASQMPERHLAGEISGPVWDSKSVKCVKAVNDQGCDWSIGGITHSCVIPCTCFCDCEAKDVVASCQRSVIGKPQIFQNITMALLHGG